jgi:hypothetical protein
MENRAQADASTYCVYSGWLMDGKLKAGLVWFLICYTLSNIFYLRLVLQYERLILGKVLHFLF